MAANAIKLLVSMLAPHSAGADAVRDDGRRLDPLRSYLAESHQTAWFQITHSRPFHSKRQLQGTLQFGDLGISLHRLLGRGASAATISSAPLTIERTDVDGHFDQLTLVIMEMNIFLRLKHGYRTCLDMFDIRKLTSKEIFTENIS